MRIALRSIAVVPSVALLSISVLSCARDLPEAPSASSSAFSTRAAANLVSTNGLYYPLQIGNTWHAAGDLSFTDRNTSGVITGQAVIHQDFVRKIVGTEERLGRTYTIMREDETDTGDVPGGLEEYTYWYRFRQDGSGLYQLDLNVTTPPGGTPPDAKTSTALRGDLPDRLLAAFPLEQQAAYRAAWDRLAIRASMVRSMAGTPGAGALDQEMTELTYPLHPGQAWTIRTDPTFTRTVEGVELLEVPAGMFQSNRIRTENEIFTGPRDREALWVSRSGQLKLTAHFETVLLSDNGSPIGTLEFDSDEELHDLSLVGP